MQSMVRTFLGENLHELKKMSVTTGVQLLREESSSSFSPINMQIMIKIMIFIMTMIMTMIWNIQKSLKQGSLSSWFQRLVSRKS